MRIQKFEGIHLRQAAALALANYEEECAAVPVLPAVAAVPGLAEFIPNGLGVAAVEDGRLLGFLCAEGPFSPAFGIPGLVGAFSPMHAHGAVRENRERVWAQMLAAAMEKWARAGATSHAVALYAHDEAAQRTLFRLGYGMRCVDAMRPMTPIEPVSAPGYAYGELAVDDIAALVPLIQALVQHLADSPTLMGQHREEGGRLTGEELAGHAREHGLRYFAAKRGGEIVAYVKTCGFGENFVCGLPGTANICGAYCLPAHRGAGAYHNLLAHLVRQLRGEGYERLGVDYESFNPTAWGFWNKHFARYTHGLARRIDTPLEG